jgi:hypothetical protein
MLSARPKQKMLLKKSSPPLSNLENDFKPKEQKSPALRRADLVFLSGRSRVVEGFPIIVGAMAWGWERCR